MNTKPKYNDYHWLGTPGTLQFSLLLITSHKPQRTGCLNGMQTQHSKDIFIDTCIASLNDMKTLLKQCSHFLLSSVIIGNLSGNSYWLTQLWVDWYISIHFACNIWLYYIINGSKQHDHWLIEVFNFWLHVLLKGHQNAPWREVEVLLISQVFGLQNKRS